MADERQEERKQEERQQQEGGKSGDSSTPDVGTRFSAKEIHDNIKEAAEEEMERSAGALSFSALLAGALMGFSFMGAAFVVSLLPERLHEAGVALAYPLGFIFVVLARHQLFTENTLEPVIPFLEQRDGETFRKLLRVWGIVLAANLVGALAIAAIIARTKLLDPSLAPHLASIATKAVSGGFGMVLYKGIFAGWLVALMAWLIGSTLDTTAQLLLVWLTTAPIAALGFKHSIAGAVEAFYCAFTGLASWGTAIGSFLIPAIIGNIIGGVVLVAVANHGQARHD